jgi:integrase
MAWLEKRADRFRINFRFGGRKDQVSLRTEDPKEAEACLHRFEENLRLVERGRLEIPPGADFGVFLLSDGKLNHRPVVKKLLTLKEFFDHYLTKHPEGAKEASTRYTEDIHIEHLTRLIGAGTAVQSINSDILQAYVETRSQETSKFKRPISHTTIKKEIGTLASIWNKWGEPQGLVTGPALTKGLVYGKAPGKPPFQTWKQIERQIARGGVSKTQQVGLWECLFLTLPEIEAVLGFVRGRTAHPFVYPMFVFAAHTGARRSEMLRSRIDDFDFAGGVVTVREKKKDRSKVLTYRTVPMTPLLRATMTEWFAEHPGGQLTICQEPDLLLTVQRAGQNFRRVLNDTKWARLSGWHVFRHSFASNCAAKGLDQRIIDAWMGHQTEDMRRRYRHLFPDHQQKAIHQVFGAKKYLPD